MGFRGSLGPDFSSPILMMRIGVKQSFALTLYVRVLTGLRLPLGALVNVSSAWRPTQTAHLQMFPQRGEPYGPRRVVSHEQLHPR